MCDIRRLLRADGTQLIRKSHTLFNPMASWAVVLHWESDFDESTLSVQEMIDLRTAQLQKMSKKLEHRMIRGNIGQ